MLSICILAKDLLQAMSKPILTRHPSSPKGPTLSQTSTITLTASPQLDAIKTGYVGSVSSSHSE